MALVSSKESLGFSIDFACRISPSVVLVSGAIRHVLTGKEIISIGDVTAEKPYIAAVLDKAAPNKIATILRIGNGQTIDDFKEITFTHQDGIAKWIRNKPFAEEISEFIDYLNTIDDAAASKILFLLMRHTAIQPEISSSEWFVKLCHAARERISSNTAKITKSIWISNNYAYIEIALPVRDYSNARLIVNSFSAIQAFVIEIFPVQITDNGGNTEIYAGIITSEHPLRERVSGGLLSLMLRDQIVPLQLLPSFGEHDVNQLVNYLFRLNDSTKFGLRDFINFTFLKSTSSNAQALDNTKIVRTLQYYLPSKHTTVHNIAEPFGINIEVAFAIGNKGIFVSGWIFDPTEMIEHLSVITDTGFSIKLNSVNLNRFARADIEEMYKDSEFSKGENNYGFIAFFEYPEDFKKKLLVWPAPFSCRFTAALQGGLSYTVASKSGVVDAIESMTCILDTVAFDARKNTSAKRHLTSALSTLQAMRVRDAAIDKDDSFGVAPQNPEASIIIPLYKSLEYVSAQIAHFACDKTLANTEIIYVLDSPEQYKYLHSHLSDLSILYKLPVRLITMKKNGGYANSTNTGALSARAEMLILFNSDVLPASNGWLVRMLEAYSGGQGDIGILAPKLLYEDDSIQHAGMYFHKNEKGNIYENRHYYKGYPRNHHNASISRYVPAVTGACMMIKKSIFNGVGNLSTDYIVGDFEDSDLCLKVHEKGYKSYYMADVEFYHFERQSMNKSKENSQARFWINAEIHYGRWQKIIPEVMQAYE